jgi:hypothetical protein
MFQFIQETPSSNICKIVKKITTFGKTVQINNKQRPYWPFRQSKLKVANMHYKAHTVIQVNKVSMSMSKGAEIIYLNNYDNG